jgi:cell division protein FtsB
MPQYRSPWRTLTKPCTILILIGIFCAVSFAYVRTIQRGEVLDHRIQSLQSDIEELSKRREELLQLKELTESPEFVEREARARLGLKKQGEHVIIVPSNSIEPYIREGQEAGGLPDAYQGMTYPRRWFYYFFGNRSQ